MSNQNFLKQTVLSDPLQSIEVQADAQSQVSSFVVKAISLGFNILGEILSM